MAKFQAVSKFPRKPISPQWAQAAEASAAQSPLVTGRPEGDEAPGPSVAPIGSATSNQPSYVVGQVYDIPLALIKSNPFNPRELYPAYAVTEMAESLKANGQRQAALGFVARTGEITLIEGETRLRGARQAALPSLRVEIQAPPESNRSLYERARSVNVERRQQTPLDDALCWSRLLADRVYPTQAALSQALGLHESYVSRVRALSSLTPKVVELLGSTPDLLTLRMLSAIREFAAEAEEPEVVKLIAEAAQSNMGYREVDARRLARKKGPVARPRSQSVPVSFQGGKGAVKAFEGAGRVELSIKGLSPEAVGLLSEKLKALLANEA